MSAAATCPADKNVTIGRVAEHFIKQKGKAAAVNSLGAKQSHLPR
jgi:hypothetical protein